MAADVESGTPQRGVRLGIDVGKVRIGVARSDPAGILATPVRTIRRRPDRSCAREIATIASEESAVEVIVGLPSHLSGKEGASATDARQYARQLADACAPIPVRLVDERLTTVSAHQALHAAGRSSRTHRGVVDQVAAVMILQNALDTMSRSGTSVGERVGTRPGTSGGKAT